MSHQEQKLTLTQAQTGMTLARDLLDARGQVLMTRGMELSANAITALQRRDVAHIWVLDPQSPTADSQNREAELRQHQQERLASLFRRVGDNAEGRYLLEIISHYREAVAP